jgi:hypothetical protein
MTRKEAERLAKQAATLQALGFTSEEAEQLRRISMTLQRWHELECNADVQRDETTGQVFVVHHHQYGHVRANDSVTRTRIADRENGAKKRLAAILKARNERPYVQNTEYYGLRPNNEPLSAYIQTDPRGAALYIIRPGDVRNGQDVESCYTNGICVY